MSAPLTNDNRMVHPYTLEKTWRATSPETFCWLSKTLYQASVVSWHVLNVLFAYRRDRNKFCSTWTDKNKREKAGIHSGIPIHAAERWPQESQQSRSSGPILNTYSEAGIPSYKTVWRNNNVKKKTFSLSPAIYPLPKKVWVPLRAFSHLRRKTITKVPNWLKLT